MGSVCKEDQGNKEGFLDFLGAVADVFLLALMMLWRPLQLGCGWSRSRGDNPLDRLMGRASVRSKACQRYHQAVTAKGRCYCWGLKNLISRLAALVWLRRVEGAENIPQQGAFLVVANHQSFLDFMLLIFALRRHNLTFFVGKEFFDLPLWNFFLAPMGHIRADRRSIGKALALLQEEDLPVMLFPEGARSWDGKVQEPRAGFGIIAEQLPMLQVVPVTIDGAFQVLSRKRLFPGLGPVRLSVGKPVSFAGFKGNRQEFAQAVMEEIARQL